MSSMSPEELAIRGQDYSHPYTTAVEHVMELYHRALSQKAQKIAELGCYQGISTVGLAYAARENGGYVCAVDLCDEVPNKDRIKYWFTINPPVMPYIFPYKMSAVDFLNDFPGLYYDFIFHDAAHGNSVVPEYKLAWDKLAKGGSLAIHDWEQVTERDDFMDYSGASTHSVSIDKRGRHLVIFTKA